VRRIGYVLYKDNLKYTGVGGALDCEWKLGKCYLYYMGSTFLAKVLWRIPSVYTFAAIANCF
jgi:hypothetical protein